MTDIDLIMQCIEAFSQQNGGGVSIQMRPSSYNFTMAETQVPTARLKPQGPGTDVSLLLVLTRNAEGCRRHGRHRVAA